MQIYMLRVRFELTTPVLEVLRYGRMLISKILAIKKFWEEWVGHNFLQLFLPAK
jgi:hypothetical protein